MIRAYIEDLNSGPVGVIEVETLPRIGEFIVFNMSDEDLSALVSILDDAALEALFKTYGHLKVVGVQHRAVRHYPLNEGAMGATLGVDKVDVVVVVEAVASTIRDRLRTKSFITRLTADAA